MATELTHLEADQPAERKHAAFHGAAEPALSPEVGSRQNVGQTHNTAPHTMRILHVPNELELCQCHVMIQAVKDSKTKNRFMLMQQSYAINPTTRDHLPQRKEVAA